MKTAILISTYNRGEYVKKCLDSLQATFLPKDTMIYIIDDASDVETQTIIKKFSKDCLIKKVFKPVNTGLYNSLLSAYDELFEYYDYVIKLDSDGMVNNYFYDMMTYYKKLFPNNMISGFNTLTLSEVGKPRHPITFDGGFYVKKKSCGSLCVGIDKILYQKYVRPTIVERLSKNKKCYDTISSKKTSNDGHDVICTVPSVCEHMGLDSSMDHHVNPDVSVDFKKNIDLTKKLITFNIATYPPREKFLRQIVENLISIKIVDKIRVYLNEYTIVPDFMKHPKVQYIFGAENKKDSGKFYWADTRKNEFYFAMDDDILVDEQYIIKHIELLQKYDSKIFVSMHGKILNKKPTDFRDYSKMFHFLEEVENDEWVNFPGTGVIVFDNSVHKIGNIFEYHGMTDLWIAKYCQQNKIPCMVRKHKKNEIKLVYNGDDTLWKNQHVLKEQHQIILNSVKQWKVLKIDDGNSRI